MWVTFIWHLYPPSKMIQLQFIMLFAFRKFSPSQLMVMGESAVGGLSLLTIQALIAHQLPVPLGSVIDLSPFTNLSMSGESYPCNHHTDLLPRFGKNWLIAGWADIRVDVDVNEWQTLYHTPHSFMKYSENRFYYLLAISIRKSQLNFVDYFNISRSYRNSLTLSKNTNVTWPMDEKSIVSS